METIPKDAILAICKFLSHFDLRELLCVSKIIKRKVQCFINTIPKSLAVCDVLQRGDIYSLSIKIKYCESHTNWVYKSQNQRLIDEYNAFHKVDIEDRTSAMIHYVNDISIIKNFIADVDIEEIPAKTMRYINAILYPDTKEINVYNAFSIERLKGLLFHDRIDLLEGYLERVSDIELKFYITDVCITRKAIKCVTYMLSKFVELTNKHYERLLQSACRSGSADIYRYIRYHHETRFQNLNFNTMYFAIIASNGGSIEILDDLLKSVTAIDYAVLLVKAETLTMFKYLFSRYKYSKKELEELSQHSAISEEAEYLIDEFYHNN